MIEGYASGSVLLGAGSEVRGVAGRGDAGGRAVARDGNTMGDSVASRGCQGCSAFGLFGVFGAAGVPGWVERGTG